MSKPEDIPQDVWDAAYNPVHTFFNNHHLWGDLGPDQVSDLREIIARAMMSAAAKEREACAQLSDEIASGRSRQKMQATTAKKRTEARDFESMAMSAIDVSYAIRKRGEG